MSIAERYSLPSERHDILLRVENRVRFDSEEHAYTITKEHPACEWESEDWTPGDSVPGVTSVIRASANVGLVDVGWRALPDTSAMMRGSMVHRATELHDRGLPLSPEVVDIEAVMPYLLGWCRYLSWLERQPTGCRHMVGIEHVVCGEMTRESGASPRSMLWAGTVDRIFSTSDFSKMLVADIKTGASSAATPIQLAAYQMALSQLYPRAQISCHEVSIRENGQVRVLVHDVGEASQRWKDCLEHVYRQRAASARG